MLSPHDQTAVASDPDLPALAFLLDDQAALHLFQQLCPELKPTAAVCTYVRYKPHTSCLAAFTITTQQGERLFYAKGYALTQLEKLTRAVDRSVDAERGNSRTLLVSKLALIVAPFPDDAKLPALKQFFASRHGKSLIARLMPEWDAWQATALVPLQYKPERRFVARIDIADKPAAAIKIHTESRYRQARRSMKSLRQLDGNLTAEAIGHSDRYHSLLWSWLPGLSLSTLLKLQQATDAMGEAAGETLARLHNHPAGKLASRSLIDENQAIRCLSPSYGYASASSASKLHRLTQRCSGALPERLSTPATTHGDFHPGQILVDAHRIALIDLDNAALGNAAYDVGNFTAHVEQAVLLGHLPEEQKEPLLTAFLQGYQRQVDVPIKHRDAQAYTAAGLIRLIHEPFRRRHPDWHHCQEKLLDRVETLLTQAESVRTAPTQCCPLPLVRAKARQKVQVADPFGAHRDACFPQLRHALNPTLADKFIGEMARQVFHDNSLEIESLRVLRHKRGRRCLIAYRFHPTDQCGELTLLGKVHAKSRHQASYRLQQALWKRGFDDHGGDGISVARPIGIVGQWNMWVQELVPGQNGWEALLGPHGDSVATRVADAAHKLHQVNALTERVHTVNDELRVLEHRLSKVINQMPSLRTRIEQVLDACRALASTLPTLPCQGIHRDFYPDQFLVNHDRIYLLDHDLYCIGDPCLDIGNFAAHLIELGLRNTEIASTLQASQHRMINRFVSLSGEARRYSVEVYTTLSLARHIYLSTQFAERRSSTLTVLAACEQRLAEIPAQRPCS